MWTSYGRRDGSLVMPVAERLFVPLLRAERWYGPVAIVMLFAFPNPLVALALAALALSLLARVLRRPATNLAALDSPAVGAIDAGFGLFTLGALFGLLVASNQGAAALRFTGLVASVAVFYLAVEWVRTEAALRRATLVGLGIVVIGTLAVLALLRGQIPESAVSRPLGPFLSLFSVFPGVSGDVLDVNTRFQVHHYGLAYLLLVGAVFAAAGLALGTTRRTRLLSGVALLAVTPLLLATQARGAMIALAVAASAVTALRTRWAWTILPISAAAFYALLARGTISRSIEAEWLDERLSYWTRTLGILGDFPFTGSGLGMRTFAEVFAWYHGLPDPYLVPHTHNIYLQAYAEQGLLGMIGLLVLMIAGIVIGFLAAKRSDPGIRWIVAGAAGALLGSAVYGLTDQVPSTNLGLGMVFGLLALVVAAGRLGRGPYDERGSERVALTPRSALVPALSQREREQVRFAGLWGEGYPLAPRLAIVVVAVIGMVLLFPRWASGLLLNWGAADVVAVAMDRSRDVEARGARLERAERMLGAAVAWNGENAAARRNLGWTRLLRHDIPGAHAVLSLPYQSELTTFERAQLARLAREVGLIDLTIGLLKDGGDEARLREVAEQAWTQRRWDSAARAYAALAELNPDEAEYVSNAAWAVLNGGGDAEAATVLLRRAVEKNPDAGRNLSRQLTLRGEPYRNDERRGGGRLEGAVFWFTLASRVDPSYDRPEVELGSVYFYRGLYEQAAHHFGEASRRDPRNPSTYNQLADTHLKLGRPLEAIGYYEKGVEVRPERPELHFNLGRAYLLVERREDALRELRAAADLAPDNVTYRDELQRVEAGG